MQSLSLFARLLILAEAMAAIAGLLTWRKWRHSYLKWFVCYLLAITGMEICYHIFEMNGYYTNASTINSCEVPLEIFTIHWFFYQTLNSKRKWLILSGLAIFVISWLLEKYYFTSPGYYFKSLSYTVGNLFILVYIILFFIELISSERITGFNKLTVFWICTGMMLFYIGTFPFYGLYNELAKNIGLFISIAWVTTTLNYCMYIFFTIGFIWGKAH